MNAPYNRNDRVHAMVWQIKAIAGLVTIFFCWVYLPLGIISFAGLLYLLLLLQHHERQTPSEGQSVVAPLDGRVVSITEDKGGVAIEIIAHRNSSQLVYAPLSGVIEDKLWVDGVYLTKDSPHFQTLSARQEIIIENTYGQMITLVQYATMITRYLSSPFSAGQAVTSGEAMAVGLIQGHVKLILPAGYDVVIEDGQSCLARETIIAQRPANAST